MSSDDTVTIKLWSLPPSSNSGVIRSFLAVTGIPFEEDNAWGKTRTPEYIAKFPNHCAPAIEHGDVSVTETATILRYLARAFPDKAGKYYPYDDVVQAAKVDMICDMINTGMCTYLPKAIYPTLSFPVYPGDVGAIDELKEKYTDVAAKAAQEALFEYLNNKVVGIFLKDTKFLLSDEPTIADFRFAPMLSQIKCSSLDLPERLVEYEAAMKELPGYADAVKPAEDYCSPFWKK
ncbi:glutathione S-transferase, N-terminal domain containing protein [Nitzschia inconspicua]|uniref:Glutathione S-transferase, N-terminal domain containing protein n=1 Tax=Nitzschia inconspicua TaxID=303405 RepID=A0A9K3LTD0_9STRA|nr:glutathione S-transferase, N-terminal domain containing protein [Nitzschia inconspicua]KAG7367847.1 glutathione S-transferase, N-terminal domain containing protein [Nitzschia inconspicua]